MNPFSALAEFVLGKMKQSLLSVWLRLLFSMAFSAIVSFLFICGSVLVATKDYPLAIGSGMVVAALSMTVLFRRSPLTKGIMVVLPAEEALKELDSNFQTINK